MPPVTKNIDNYAGRTVDILAFDGKFDNSSFELSQTLRGKNNESGKVVAGIQKLAQRWLIELLTPAGSMPYMKDRGSNFINQARSGRIRNESDLTSVFNFAKEAVAFNLRKEDALGTYPNDEMYGDAILLGVSVKLGSKISLSVKLDSLAGSSRTFIVPVSITPAR